MNWLRALVVAALCTLPVSASAWWQSVPQVSVGPPPSYQGPADALGVNPQIWGSCAFAVSAAYANGSNTLCRLKDVATGAITVCTIRVTTFGIADLTAYCPGGLTPAAACAAVTSCVLDFAPNQINPGTRDMSSPALANMPGIVFTDFGGLPTVVCTGTTVYMESSTTVAPANPYTMVAVGIRTGNFTTQSGFVGGSSNVALGNSIFANNFQLNAGASGVVLKPGTDNAWHSIIGLATGGVSAVVNIDGVDGATGNAGVGTINGTNFRMCRANGLQVTGRQSEWGYWNGNQNRTTIYSNASARYSGAF